MDPVRYQRVKQLFADAVELPRSERPAFLAVACGEDHELRAEVESLLQYEVDDDFLEPVLPSLTHDPAVADVETAALDSRVGTTIGAYHVLDRLGAGGMGVVYLAEDMRLGRRAALKFLRHDRHVDDGAKARFVREARAVAALDHPNICTLYGIDHTEDGQTFLAMAYYQGETLKARLARGRLPVAASTDIARQIGSGLAAAHAAGVVHRDLKPGNIMLSDPMVKILDFGIAKLANQTTLTMHGASLGTAAYISPEQAAGGAVDHRTDVWALGVVLYEMVTGVRPFDVDSFAGLALAAHTTPPPPPRNLRPDIPIQLENCIIRALSVNPDERFQSMRDFVTALEGVDRTEQPSTAIVVTAVGTPLTADGVLTRAVSEVFVDILSGIAALTVIFQPDPPATGERAPAVSIETVLSPDGMAAVSATMTNASRHVVEEWKANEHVSELPRLLGRIAAGVAAGLGVRLTSEDERRLSTQRSVSPQSYLAYLRGRWQLSQGTGESCRAALASFEEASANGGRDARAFAGVVEASVALAETACAADRDRLAAGARAALGRAIEIDAADPEVLFASAQVAGRLDWSATVAETRLRQLLAMHPGYGRAYVPLAECLIATGKFSDAIAMAQAALERQPSSAPTLLRMGRVLHFARDYREAARVFAAAVRIAPEGVAARFDLALTLARLDEGVRARAECDEALSTVDGRALMVAVLGNAARARGDLAAYESAKRLLQSLNAGLALSACCAGILDAAFGDTNRALEYWDPYDETLGLAKFVGFAPVRGSLSTYLHPAGLIVYFDFDPAFRILHESSHLRALRARMVS